MERSSGRSAEAPATRAAPPQGRPGDRVEHTDAVHALLTLPERTSGHWSDEQTDTWALLVVPAARRALMDAGDAGDAGDAAARAGATGEQASVTATAHVLLGLALTALGTRVEVLGDRVAPAYEALERSLPMSVVTALPPRVAVARDRFRERALATLVAVGLTGLAVLELDRLAALLG